MSTVTRKEKVAADTNGELRPRSLILDFDAGRNTSVAWTRTADNDEGKNARAVYPFSGSVEFHELNDVEVGDELQVLQDHVGDGWSLVRASSNGKVGLIPTAYYAYISDLSCVSVAQHPSQSLQSHHELSSQEDISLVDISSHLSLSILPQNTGDWIRTFAFPGFRQALLGGRSLNRFSSFVTSGAEQWILSGMSNHNPVEAEDMTITTTSTHQRSDTSDSQIEGDSKSNNEVDRHYIDVGPTWVEKIPPVKIVVHSPEKRTTPTTSFVIYTITTFFQDNTSTLPGSRSLTVYRRFSHFTHLHAILVRKLPGIALPPLPQKQYTGRFSKDFIEARKGDLERYLEKLAGHPIVRYTEIFTLFLSCENDSNWAHILSEATTVPPAGSTFYARIYHPAFNVDVKEAEEVVKGFYTHIKANSVGIQYLRNIFGTIREARIGMSKADRILSYSLISLITSSVPPETFANGESDGNVYDTGTETGKPNGNTNSEGAWCWREGCKDCLKLSKGVQLTAEAIYGIADLYDDHARRTQLETHEALKKMAHSDRIYEGIVGTHQSTLSRYKDAESGEQRSSDGGIASRCETVLNSTMAEMEVYHQQKVGELHSLMLDHLDGEIALYEKILERLKTSRRRLSGTLYDELASSPRPISRHERELDKPRLNPPLPQPYPHVFDRQL